MNQSRRAIWSRHQRRERGHQVTPHSLILTRFPLLLSSPLLIFSYPSFLVSSFFLSWCCFVLCYFFCCRFNHIFFSFVIVFCFLFFTCSSFTYVSSFLLVSCAPPFLQQHLRHHRVVTAPMALSNCQPVASRGGRTTFLGGSPVVASFGG